MAKKYGIFSDVHKFPEKAKDAVECLMNKNPDSLILNGDIGDSVSAMNYVWNVAGKSGVLVYINAGNHESIYDFERAYSSMKCKFPNVISLIHREKGFKVNQGNHDLVFIPGDQVREQGGFRWVSDAKTKTGYNGDSYYFNLRDLNKLIKRPERTIVVSHGPLEMKCSGAIDSARYGKINKDFIDRDNNLHEKNDEVIGFFGDYLKSQGCQLEEIEKNGGSKELARILKGKGVTKFVCGHMHENAHRVHNSHGNTILNNEMKKEIYCCASNCDDNKIGILTADRERAGFERIIF